MSDDLIFHFRALAAAGDPIAITVVRGMELAGATELVIHPSFSTVDILRPRPLGIDQLRADSIKEEMIKLGWQMGDGEWFHERARNLLPHLTPT